MTVIVLQQSTLLKKKPMYREQKKHIKVDHNFIRKKVTEEKKQKTSWHMQVLVIRLQSLTKAVVKGRLMSSELGIVNIYYQLKEEFHE